MIKAIQLTGIASACLLLASCAQPTVYPEKDGSFKLISTSSSSHYANKSAKNKAVKVCDEQGKNLQVTNVDEVYQGVDKTAGAAMTIASALLSNGAGQSSSSENDYKVTMNFRCV